MRRSNYTANCAALPEALQRRRWAFVPDTSPQLIKSPDAVADEAMNRLRSVDEKTKRSLAVRVSSVGADTVMRDVLATVEGSDEFKALVRQALEERGWADLCVSFVAFLSKNAAEESGTNLSRTRGSDTAQGTATLRYVADLFGFGPDHLAKYMCDQQQLKAFVSTKGIFERTGRLLGAGDDDGTLRANEPWNVSLCNVTFMQNRTCFGDDAMCQFMLDFPHCNVVLLGAGYDTRFYRLHVPSTVALFEVDTQPSSTAKQEKLRQLAEVLNTMRRVHYVVCDFESQSWFDIMCANAEFSPASPTLVILEGVTQYITRSAFEATLDVISNRFSAPCAIAFDYFAPQLVAKFAEAMQQYGEEFTFGLDPEDMSALIVNKKLIIIDHLSMQECSVRYMPYAKETWDPLGLATAHKCFVIAANRLC